jgi:hypothetical protein
MKRTPGCDHIHRNGQALAEIRLLEFKLWWTAEICFFFCGLVLLKEGVFPELVIRFCEKLPWAVQQCSKKNP